MSEQAEFLTAVELPRRSTGEQVAEALREAIFTGRLEPGAHLREATLAKAFNVSRNTVRGAIQTLDRDGLVTHHKHRGAFVTEPEPGAIEDVYATRRLIELSALETAPSVESLLPLEAALRTLRIAIDGGDNVAIRDADLAFHRGVAALQGSPRLSSLFDELVAETRLLALLVGNAHPEPEALYAEDAQILELLRQEDLDQARDLLEQQLRDTESLLIAALARRRAAPITGSPT